MDAWADGVNYWNLRSFFWKNDKAYEMVKEDIEELVSKAEEKERNQLG